MRALDTLRDMIALANQAGEDGGCPCSAFPHLRDIPGNEETMTQLLAELSGAADMLAHGLPDAAVEHAGHVLVIALATGYALGAESAYDTVLRSEVTVPDTLAALDILGDD